MTHGNELAGREKLDADGLSTPSKPAGDYLNGRDPHEELVAGMRRFKLAPLHGTAATTRAATLDMLRDVKFDARINLGRTYMHRKNVSELGQGDIVPLDKVVDEPVEILVGGRLIARGDIFMLNNKFCVRVSEMTGGVATV